MSANELYIGIDLGTTYSTAAYLDKNGTTQIVENAEGGRLTPSAVFFDSDEIIVGEDAAASAEFFPRKVARFFKRYMGEPDYSFQHGDKSYSAAELSSFVLMKIKKDLAGKLGSELPGVIITVPAYFGDPQRRDTLKAAQLAGLQVRQLLNEPTAAAYSYGLQRMGKQQRTLVFDLGGGTFDVTVVEIKDDLIMVKSTGGDHQLGGLDWDEALANNLNEAFMKRHRINLFDSEDNYQQLWSKAAQAKVSLSSLKQVSLTLQAGGKSLKAAINRQQFEELTRPLLERCRMLVEMVLEEASVRPQEIQHVLLVGGATRMPMVGRMLESFFGFPPGIELNPDECVAMGAAVKAALLYETDGGIKRRSGSTRQLIKMHDINVISHSFGFVVLKEGEFYNSVIIPKNTPYPCEMSRENYTTTFDNQLNLQVILTEGEEDDPHYCSLIGHYEAYDLPPSRAGELRLRFTYRYNENQVVEVAAYDLTNQKQLPVRPLEGVPQLASLLAVPLDVTLLLDCSYSMGGSPLREAKKAAINFIKNFKHPVGRIALVTFPGGVAHHLYALPDELPEKINKMFATNGTPMAEAFQQALQDVFIDPGNDKVIILLTDGAPNDWEATVQQVKLAQSVGIRVIAVGVRGADECFLRGVVKNHEDFYWAGEPVRLSDTFSHIATELSAGAPIKRR